MVFLQVRHQHLSLTRAIMGVDVVRLGLKADAFFWLVKNAAAMTLHTESPRASSVLQSLGAALLYMIFRIRIR